LTSQRRIDVLTDPIQQTLARISRDSVCVNKHNRLPLRALQPGRRTHDTRVLSECHLKAPAHWFSNHPCRTRKHHSQHAAFPAADRPPSEEVDKPRPVHALTHVRANLAQAIKQDTAHLVVKQLCQVRDRRDYKRRLREVRRE
jgi:hypothetical protein